MGSEEKSGNAFNLVFPRTREHVTGPKIPELNLQRSQWPKNQGEEITCKVCVCMRGCVLRQLIALYIIVEDEGTLNHLFFYTALGTDCCLLCLLS